MKTILQHIAVAAVVLTSGFGAAYAAGGDPIEVPTRSATPGRSGELRYNQGLALAQQGDWPGAEAAYRDAIRLKPDLPEAWNGLGHALKSQSKLAESIPAYHEALRLRPNYAQALQYLGETYMRLGQVDDARAVLTRLEPLDQQLAEQLALAILTGTVKW